MSMSSLSSRRLHVGLFCLFSAYVLLLPLTCAFLHPPGNRKQSIATHPNTGTCTQLSEMKRPILDQIASTLFKLENDRVESSSVVDEKGRKGEPMEWSKKGSLASTLSEVMASGPGYAFKQFVADIIAGEYDEQMVRGQVDAFVEKEKIAMFSFSTCPFCRRAKDYLDDRNIPYTAMELDLLEDNAGNEIRAVLGKKVKRTSVPAIFINGEFVGGCNDGPGLLTLADSGDLDEKLKLAGLI